MPQDYYPPSSYYPPIILAIVERVKYHICSLLYPDEEYTESSKRFILTSFSATSEEAIRKSIENFKTLQGKFPFTAYGIGDLTPVVSKRSHKQKNFTYYSSSLGLYVSAQPSLLNLNMISFFTTPNDYFRALTVLQTDSVNLSRLVVPITINGQLCSTTIDLLMEEVTRGDFAFEFETYLRTGRIFNINHPISIYFHNLVLQGNINPVDDIECSLFALSDIDISLSVLKNKSIMPPTPTIINTEPQEGETNVDRDNPILLYFSVPMNEESVENALSTSPFISADLVWNSSGTILLIEPTERMFSGTLYTISLSKNATSANSIPLEEDFDLTFTTGVN